MVCILCRVYEASSQGPLLTGAAGYICECCGTYEVTGSAEAMLQSQSPDPRLIGFTRNQWESGAVGRIDSGLMSRIADLAPSLSVGEKQHLLLRWLARKSQYPGDAVRVFPARDWPVLWARRTEELSFHLAAAERRGFIRQSSGNGYVAIELTDDGWAQLDRGASDFMYPDRAFVAMSFHESMHEAWTSGIKPGIERTGFRALRVDSTLHLERIDLKIVGDIRASRFVVADVTRQSQGVYFEAGFALALGRPVVWTVQEDELKHVHFDTRQFQHIVWKAPAELADRLEEVIAGTIGRRA